MNHLHPENFPIELGESLGIFGLNRKMSDLRHAFLRTDFKSVDPMVGTSRINVKRPQLSGEGNSNPVLKLPGPDMAAGDQPGGGAKMCGAGSRVG
jgi:hypothetical protein